MKTNFIVSMLVLGMTTSFCAEPVSAQNKLTPDHLKPTRKIADDEKCEEFITGQFFFKICREVEETIITERIEMVDKTCVVFDPVKCCNVIVTKKVPEKRKIEETKLVPKEIVFCKEVRIRLDQLERLPECPCADSEFLKVGKAATEKVQDASKPAAERSEPTTLAAAIRSSNNQKADAESESATKLVPIQWDSSSQQTLSPEKTTNATNANRPQATVSVAVRPATNSYQSNHSLAPPAVHPSAQASGVVVIQPQTTIVQRTVWPSIHTLPNVAPPRIVTWRPQ